MTSIVAARMASSPLPKIGQEILSKGTTPLLSPLADVVHVVRSPEVAPPIVGLVEAK